MTTDQARRYVILSYELNHRDGRKSFPLVLINWAPTSCEIGLTTLHASAFLDFQTQARMKRFAPVPSLPRWGFAFPQHLQLRSTLFSSRSTCVDIVTCHSMLSRSTFQSYCANADWPSAG
jgi:hypothetical protein